MYSSWPSTSVSSTEKRAPTCTACPQRTNRPPSETSSHSKVVEGGSRAGPSRTLSAVGTRALVRRSSLLGSGIVWIHVSIEASCGRELT